MSVAFRTILSVIIAVTLLGATAEAQEVEAISASRAIEVVVGEPETAILLRDLRAAHPEAASQIDQIRIELAQLPIGTKVNIEVEFVDGELNTINWSEVFAGAAAGVALGVLWAAFGGEVLCLVGVAPMCACVGPQC